MTKIIKNLLTLADIENLPAFRLEKRDLKNFILHALQQLENIYPQLRYTIESTPEKAIATFDPELFEVAITNLLDNAAKYSKENPLIEVKITEDESFFFIAIRDHGIGIPEADLEHIFNRFYTVNKAESKKKGGSGLGLSIVETIVTKHFGTIEVTSKIGEGTTFTIKLPKKLSERLEQ